MKMTQVFKVYWPDNGGRIAKVMENIAECLTDCTNEIIVCQDSRYKKGTNDNYKGVAVRRCRQIADVLSTPFSLQFLVDVKRRTKDSDIVIYHFPYPMADLAVLFGMYSGKLVVWWHCDFEKYKKWIPVYDPLVKHTLKKADRILVSSKRNIKNSKVLLPYRKKCSVIPFCVSKEYLDRGMAHASDAHVKKGQVSILFIGRLVWYKGCDVLLRAFAMLKQKNCRLVLVGGGPLEEKLKALAVSLNLENVEFTGMVSEEEKIRRIEACDFLVLPSVSKAEAFAVVQIEAMAFGKPVINTALPSGVPCVSVDKVTGTTVMPGNIRELAKAMEELVEDEKLRRKYGANAVKKVHKEYTRKVMEIRLREVFLKLLEE